MPPKKNLTTSEETTKKPIESSSSGKNMVKVEEITRVLRPRKAAPPSESATKPVKTKKDNTTKKDAATKEKSSNKGKKTKAKKETEEGEPPTKLNKIEPEEDHNGTEESLDASSIYEFKVNTIQGKEISLSKYKGHVCIIVNVASKCGHTASNYKELVELYDKYGKDKGLRILAFPCNQFGKQEPGENKTISEFAKKKNVQFDMFEKIEVNGQNAHPLWKFLTSQKDGPKGAKIDWNFTKFLINKSGQVVERFKSAVKPLAMVEELEKLW